MRRNGKTSRGNAGVSDGSGFVFTTAPLGRKKNQCSKDGRIPRWGNCLHRLEKRKIEKKNQNKGYDYICGQKERKPLSWYRQEEIEKANGHPFTIKK